MAAKHPSSIIFAAGWSLGANILLCYLAEEGEGTPISAAVSMCNPFDLMKANLGLKEGFSQVWVPDMAQHMLPCAAISYWWYNTESQQG